MLNSEHVNFIKQYYILYCYINMLVSTRGFNEIGIYRQQ